MDPLTHSLAALTLARRHATWTALIAANMADLDVLMWPLYGAHGYMMEHRGFTHSLLGVFTLSLVAAAVLSRVFRAPLRPLWSLALACAASHTLLDLLSTGWGVMVFEPFDRTRVGAAWLFGVDPWLWVLLGLGFWGRRFVFRSSDRARHRLALALAVAYVAFAGVMTQRAGAIGRELAAREGVLVEDVQVWPTPLGPTTRSVVVRGAAGFAHHAWVHVLDPPAGFRARWPTNLAAEEVAFTLTRNAAHKFMSWAADPIAIVRQRDDAGERLDVELLDLRTWSPVLGAPTVSMVLELHRPPRAKRGEVRKRQPKLIVDAWRWELRGAAPWLLGL